MYLAISCFCSMKQLPLILQPDEPLDWYADLNNLQKATLVKLIVKLNQTEIMSTSCSTNREA